MVIYGIFLTVIIPSFLFAQVFTSLRIPSNAEMMGMGFASVAHITDNPSAINFNPAHLGLQSLNNNVIALSTNYIDWMRRYREGMYIRSITLSGGVNLQKYFPKLPHIAVGLAYTNTRMNVGHDGVYDGYGQVISDIYDAHEESNQITISSACDYYVRLSGGITYKRAKMNYYVPGSADLYDWGVILNIPVVEIVDQATEKPILLSRGLAPFLDITIGAARCNLGGDAPVTSSPHSSYQPRYASEGIEYDLGFTYTKNDITIRPISFAWTTEANCQLANLSYDYSKPLPWGYKSGMGNINFFKEVILGTGNVNTDKLKGWELGFFDMVMMYGGSFTEDDYHGGRNFLTSGIGFRMSGLIKTLASFDKEMLSSDILNILNHFDLKINSSIVYGKKYYPVMDGMRYYSLNLYWINW